MALTGAATLCGGAAVHEVLVKYPKEIQTMVSFHTADSYSILGMVLGVVVVPIAILGTLFAVVQAVLGV